MKRTIEIDDTLQDRIDSAISDVRDLLDEWLTDNADADETPCLNDDLDYGGSVHEIIDSSTPVYYHEIDTIFYLHGSEVEAAFDDAGFDDKNDAAWPAGWRAAAIYCYIEQAVNEWYQEHADDIFEAWQAAQPPETEA